MGSQQLELSVIIPSFKTEALVLQKSLRALVEAKGDRSGVELILVESTPEFQDDSLEEFKRAGVRILRPDQRLLAGAARNLGAKEARSQALGFVDADCMVDQDWIERALDLSRRFDLVTGFIDCEAGYAGWPLALHLWEFNEFIGAQLGFARFPVSCNMLIRKDLLNSLGGFPSDWGSSQDLGLFRNQDFTDSRFIPDLKVTHQLHLESPQEIAEKVSRMGFWRGYCDRDLTKRLRITKGLYRVLFPIWGLCCFGIVLWRMFRTRSPFRAKAFKVIRPLFILCWQWGIAFNGGFRDRGKGRA
ncbi:MAG: glycosyltransferase family 2 protein [Bradymonadales bacterium]|nr:MAG: glycosyltransferase family 2 protein [Bradymonadales bacterium]